MIDTDKYEGHTPTDEWRMVFTTWCKDKQMLGLNVEVHDLAQMQACDPDLYLVAEANQDLVKDAPLLLEEVKRLREQLGRYTQFVLWVEEEHNEVFDEYEGKDEL